MAYVDYDQYVAIYGDKAVSEADFNRLSWDCQRKLDIATSGIDGVKKLQIAFPTDEYDAEAVRRCLCKLIEIAYLIEQAEESARNAQGFIQRADGSLQNKVVSSVSAGNESISYTSGSSAAQATIIDKALADKAVQTQLYTDTINDYLSGVADANGVNLLYMGGYPPVMQRGEDSDG